MLWVKAFHIIAMVAWFAGLFYLPRLFVYHAQSMDDRTGCERFKVMERKLYRGIMTPAAVLTIGLGVWMLADYAWRAYAGMGWLHAKLALVAVLVVYHLYCGRCLRVFAADRSPHGHVFFRWFNEFPVVLLTAIVCLVVIRPF